MEELDAEASTGVPSASDAHLEELKNLPTEERQHTLDSDEEESGEEEGEIRRDQRKYDVLNEDDIEGQEEAGFQDKEERMTAFNIREELEEGHFDTDGNFIWNKDKDIRDEWLDNIDWVKVEHKKETEEADEDSDEEAKNFDEKEVYRQILEMLRPGESISSGLKRLGGGKKQKRLSTQERWKRKKAGLPLDNTNESSESVTRLTGLADSILTQLGHMDVYQETFESIQLKVKPASSGPSSSKRPASPSVDMFADEEVAVSEVPDAKKPRVAFLEPAVETIETDSKSEEGANKDGEGEERMWEYQLNGATQGPFTSKQMLEKSEIGDFGEGGVLCRRLGQDRWYSSTRIDFEIYLDD